MKIYGQELLDILRKLPWQYKIVVGLSIPFLLLIVIYIPLQLWGAVTKPAVPSPVEFSGKAADVFDPALAADPKTNTVWMAYAAIEENAAIRVRLASARGKDCDSWAATDAGFAAKPDEILAPDGQTVFRTGSWRIETPSLVYDPQDAGHEWKLYAYKYFWPTEPAQRLQIAQHYGMIVYKYAADPAGEWSTEQWLFSPGADYPPPPYDQMVPLKLNALHPGLGDVVAYARPSVLVRDGVLYMTLSAFTGASQPDRIVMIVSRDHGQSWAYAGTPLRAADVSGTGAATTLAGATLIEQDGQPYLAAVLGDSSGNGTYIFGFDDFAAGKLNRTPVREIAPRVAGQNPVAGGFLAYTAACKTSFLTGDRPTPRAHFQIFKTSQKPVMK